METTKKQKKEKKVLLAKFLIGAGSASLGIRIVRLCERYLNPTLFTRPIGMYDVVRTVIALSLILMGVYMFSFWKKKKNEDQDMTNHDIDSA